jgi:hypothetical protein
VSAKTSAVLVSVVSTSSVLALIVAPVTNALELPPIVVSERTSASAPLMPS